MKYIVLSDTHSEDIPQVLLEDIKESDGIIHVGDFCDVDLFNRLKKMKNLHCVYGNMDGSDLRSLMPAKLSFLCGDVTVGLIHGDGAPDMVLDKVQAAFRGTKVNVVIFGHSHKTCNVVIDGVLFFNPGSPTDTIRAPFRSYGILEISGLKVKGKIVKIK